MNSLYPSGGGLGSTGARLDGPNPNQGGITPPMMPPQIDFNQLLQIRESENRDALNRETNVLKPRLNQIADQVVQPKQPLNYLPPNYISPTDQAKLDVAKRGQDIQEKLGQARVGVSEEGLDVRREGITNQKELGEKRIDTTRQLGEGKLDIEQSKLNLADWKAKHPNGKIIEVKGGNIQVVDPQTGKTIDTGIPSGTMTEQASITAKGNESRATKATIPGRAPVNSNADLPTQQKVGTQLSAQKIMNEHPEWAKFIKIDPNSGLVIVQPPGGGMMGYGGGPDLGTFSAINQALYPKKVEPSVIPAKVETKPSTEVMEKTQRNSAGQTRVVVSSDGGKTWTPKK